MTRTRVSAVLAAVYRHLRNQYRISGMFSPRGGGSHGPAVVGSEITAHLSEPLAGVGHRLLVAVPAATMRRQTAPEPFELGVDGR